MAAVWDDNTDLTSRDLVVLSFWIAKMRGIVKNRAAKQTIACPNLKNIRNFVVATSLILAVWLGLTFVTKVPSHRYPTLGKDVQNKGLSAAVGATKENLATVPVPH